MKKKVLYSFILVGIFLILVQLVYASTFQDNSASNFNNGTHQNTTYNSSDLVLTSDALSGTFTSRIFDATSPSFWENLSWTGVQTSSEELFAVDGSGSVFSSLDQGINWVEDNTDFGRSSDTEEMFSNNGFVYIISNSNKEIWISDNLGVNWTVINDTFADSGLLVGESNSSGALFIADASGDVYLSTDNALNWELQGDFNGGSTNNAKGMAINSSGAIFIVDGSGSVFSSLDQGINWVEETSGFGGGSATDDLEVDSANNLYILFNKDIYKSTDSGKNWTVINDSFTSFGSDGVRMLVTNSDRQYILDGSGRTFTSTDSGTSWTMVGDLDGTSATPKGITQLIINTSITFQARNCSSSNCADASFSSYNLDNLNLTGRYFQYQVQFTSPEINVTPYITQTTINYQILDAISPNISIIAPVNQNYTNATILINISSQDDNLDKIWFDNGTGNTTYTQETYQTFPQGTNILIAYANDTAGNVNQTLISFFVDSIGPQITIINPKAQNYGVNTSLPLNYSVSDAGVQVESCWWNLNNGVNQSIICGQNTSFDIVTEGTNSIYLFANDSLGNVNNKNVTFYVTTSAPALNLDFPTNNSYLSYNGTIQLNYSVFSGLGPVSSCQLFGDFNGTWQLNQSNSSISQEENSFEVSLEEGEYNWGIVCNDTQNRISAINYTFSIDTTNPQITISQPTGTQNSLNEIPIAFSITDSSPTFCIYNVMKGASFEIVNTSIDCSSPGTFSVSSEGNYIFNLFINDSAGNSNHSNSSFTVTIPTTTPGGGNGGGGGGGGGGGFLPTTTPQDSNEMKIQFSGDISNLMKKGTSQQISLIATNNGGSFVNDCSLEFVGDSASWLKSTQTKGLAQGEKFAFSIAVSIPEDVEAGDHFVSANLNCEEGQSQANLKITVYRNSFEAQIIDYQRDGNTLKVTYKVDEYAGENHDITLDYFLADFDDIVRYENQEKISIKSKESSQRAIEFTLPKDSFGEFKFKMKLNDGSVETTSEKEIFLPSQQGLSGLVISEDNKKAAKWVSFLVVILIIGFIAIRAFIKFKRKTKQLGHHHKKNKKLLELEL